MGFLNCDTKGYATLFGLDFKKRNYQKNVFQVFDKSM